MGFTIEQKIKIKDIWVNIDKMELKKKTHDKTQGNNENKRGVVRKMQTKSEGICG